MKRLPILKTLVTIAFIICMVVLFFGLPFILILAVAPNQVPFAFSSHWGPVAMFSFLYVVHAIFTYGIYQFKTTLELFSKKIFFDDRTIHSLGLTGKSFITASLISIAVPFFYKMFEGKLEAAADFSMSSPLFMLGLGLFFIVLSEVFANAKNLKKENDLTI